MNIRTPKNHTSKPTIIPVPFAMSPYGNNNDKTYLQILSVTAANPNMQEKFPSNLLLNECFLEKEVEFEVLPDDDETGLYMNSASSMQQNLANSITKNYTSNSQFIIIGGDHTISIGTGLGLSKCLDLSKIGLIWVDAHADCNTPKTSLSKSITGYPVAINCGVGPQKLIASFENNFIENIAYIGLRDIDQNELSNITHVNPIVYSNLDIENLGLKKIIKNILQKFSHLDYIWLSIDIDSLDPIYFKTNETDVPVVGGLTPRELLYITDQIQQSNKLLVTEIVQLNDMNLTTPLTVLCSRIAELSIGLGRFRYGK
jgi:arginase